MLSSRVKEMAEAELRTSSVDLSPILGAIHPRARPKANHLGESAEGFRVRGLGGSGVRHGGSGRALRLSVLVWESDQVGLGP